MRSTRDAGIRSRTLIVLHAAAGKSSAQIADAVGYDPSLPPCSGALHTRTGQVFWVGNGKKNSYLFLQLLRRLIEAFPHATTLHVVLDNYGIHSSRLVQWALPEEFQGRIVLHFLPPYSPAHNRIERLWRELHANVNRNHRCATLADLLRRVAAFLRRVSPYPGTKASLLRAPQPRAA